MQFCKKDFRSYNKRTKFDGVWRTYGVWQYLMELQIKIKMMCFWNKLVGNPDKFLSGKIYRLLFKLFIRCNRDIPWMDYTTSIFDEIGLAIYGMVKNTLTLICWRLLLNKDYKINIFKNGFQI